MPNFPGSTSYQSLGFSESFEGFESVLLFSRTMTIMTPKGRERTLRTLVVTGNKKVWLYKAFVFCFYRLTFVAG